MTIGGAERRVLIGVTVGHAAHDTWFGVAPILLAALSTRVHLANSEIGLMMLLYQGLSSLTQPLFGRLSEHYGGRTFGVVAILWTTTMFSCSLFAQSKPLLALFIFLAGFGSGAWHPQGAANATAAGGERWGATTASIFFQGGTLGSALLGAALGGFLLDRFGSRALLAVSAVTVLLALTVVRGMVPQRVMVARRAVHLTGATPGGVGFAFWAALVILLLSTALRSLTFQSLNTYVPKYQQDLGATPATYGLLMSAYMVASAIGGLFGSFVADRIGLRRVLVGSLVGAALFFHLFLHTQGIASYVLFTLTGFLLSPSHTLYVVAAQRQFPQRIAMISGAILGFTFVSGSGGAYVVGLLADHYGLGATLGTLTWVLVVAGVVAVLGVPRHTDRQRLDSGASA